LLASTAAARSPASGSDVVLHLTEWKQFREIDPAKSAGLVANLTIIDGRNALDPTLWRKAGWAEPPERRHPDCVMFPARLQGVPGTRYHHLGRAAPSEKDKDP